MYRRVNELREAIAREGTPAIQDAWDQVEQFLDYAFQQNTTPPPKE